jgi:eukaryotic-like serine/threonine-protein kinase
MYGRAAFRGVCVLGTNIGNYTVKSMLGRGGMGTVYLAEHAMLGRRAAVKVLLSELSSNDEVVSRFFNEARALTAIRHPSIVEIFDFGYLPDASAYLVMEYLEGESLGARCHRLHTIEPRRALTVVRQIAGALAAAHDRGVIHRDLKPENIFLVPDPEVPGGERVKVLDFGIAKLAGPGDSAQTQTGSVLGSPAYMSPEQCRGAGDVDARADLYALGCVLYEMLCERPPFVTDGIGDLIAHHMYFPPEPPRSFDPTIPEAVEQLVLALLEKEPEARPQSAREVVDTVDRLIAAGAYTPDSSAAPLPRAMTRIGSPTTPPRKPRVPTPVAGVAQSPRPRSTQAPTPVQTPRSPAAQVAVLQAPSADAGAPATAAPGATSVTTLSGATGVSMPAMSSVEQPHRRWVIPAVAGSLIALGAAISFAVGTRITGPAGEPRALPAPAARPAAPPLPVVERDRPVAPAPDPAAAAPAPVAPAAPPAVALAIDSVPPGASVLVDGVLVGTTPFDESIAAAAGERVYTLDKNGYEPVSVSLATDRAGSERVVLRKKKVRPSRGSAESVGDRGVNPFD